MEFLKSKLVWLTGSFVFIIAIIKSLVVCQIRLRSQHGHGLYDRIQKDAKKLVLNQEWYNGELPKEYNAICFIKRILLLIDIKERVLQAGADGTDIIIYVTCLRWNVNKLLKIIKESEKNSENRINVSILEIWHADRIGTIETIVSNPYLHPHQYEHIDSDIRRTIKGEIFKTGAILHGYPGNGKTSLVRYFACKYGLPIFLALPDKNYSDQEVLKMFRHAKPPCIVLFEDFDSLYDNRKCLIEKVNHTFDVFLSVLDGIYTGSKGIVYFMTVNDISKVDVSLKDRPSRFRFVQEIPNPDDEIRRIIYNNDDFVNKTKGLNLDQVLKIKESYENDI